MPDDKNKWPVGLFSGKMGLAIYFYHQARISAEKKYEIFAEELLASVYEKINEINSIDIESGLIGVGEGILYLINKNFVGGNPNTILKDIDAKIFSTLYFNHLADKPIQSIKELIVIVKAATYFCKRLSNQHISKDERYLLQQIIIRSINKIETVLNIDKMSEPFPFSPYRYFIHIYLNLIGKVYELGFYNYKVKKICDEWSDRLLSTLPLLQSHRFLLSKSLYKINKFYQSPDWSEYIELLTSRFGDFKNIINEFKNKNIWVQNGLCGFYSMMDDSMINNELLSMIKERIFQSDCWEQYENATDVEKLSYLGLMSGLSGIVLAYQEVKLKF